MITTIPEWIHQIVYNIVMYNSYGLKGLCALLCSFEDFSSCYLYVQDTKVHRMLELLAMEGYIIGRNALVTYEVSYKYSINEVVLVNVPENAINFLICQYRWYF